MSTEPCPGMYDIPEWDSGDIHHAMAHCVLNKGHLGPCRGGERRSKDRRSKNRRSTDPITCDRCGDDRVVVRQMVMGEKRHCRACGYWKVIPHEKPEKIY